MPPPKRDLESTRNRLQAWFQRRLRDARDLSVGELRGPSDTGFSSDTLLFDLRWRTSDGQERCEKLVARLAPTGFTVFPHYEIGKQYRVMEAVGRAGVPVPRVRWLEEDPEPLGTPFLIMEQVEGRVPTDNPPYHTGGWVTELTPGERARLWWNGLETMARIHVLDWRELGLAFLDEPERGRTPLQQHLRAYEEYVQWGMEPRRYPLIQRTAAWLRENRPPEEHVALCWGDSRPGNQIFDEHLRCVAVLDWEMARLGDPVQDLAWWIAMDRCFSEGIGVERLPGFPGREETIRRWEACVGRPADHFPYYEVFALYRFSVIMARVALQLKHYEILPPDHDMDVNNLASQTLARTLEEAAGGTASA